ncbi:MAG TPA: 50S ribosomal protein L19 [bacterium]|nr:50S ribosomal protein L19 [bacterium]HOL46944.1 50S ribosomal protein L19 [bacterium]HPQ18210.1 50S ribosomal protein L19 [bacterium]
MDLIEVVEKQYMKEKAPKFKVGDQVKVYIKLKEAKRERSQAFEGVVISIRGSGLRTTFTVRRVTGGYGIERTFPLHSPIIEKIKVVKKGEVRKAKLYYLKGKSKKEARIKEAKRALISNGNKVEENKTTEEIKQEAPVAEA